MTSSKIEVQNSLVVKKGKYRVVVERSKGETIEHWFLKIAGIVELLRRRFESKNIEVEKHFKRGRASCRADVYAKKVVKRKELEVWLECEHMPSLSSFFEKVTRIRRIFPGKIIFLLYLEDYENFLESLKDGMKNANYRNKRAIFRDIEFWAIDLGTLPRVAFKQALD